MRLTTRHDLAIPAAALFEALADTGRWERMAMRRGVDVRRTETAGIDGIGPAWDCLFPLRGRTRRIVMRLTRLDPPARIDFAARARGYDIVVAADVIVLSPRECRLLTRSDLRATSIAARVVLQSARLVKARLEQRLQDRMALLTAEIEARHRSAG